MKAYARQLLFAVAAGGMLGPYVGRGQIGKKDPELGEMMVVFQGFGDSPLQDVPRRTKKTLPTETGPIEDIDATGGGLVTPYTWAKWTSPTIPDCCFYDIGPESLYRFIKMSTKDELEKDKYDVSFTRNRIRVNDPKRKWKTDSLLAPLNALSN
jgi:hypothetical protein